MGSSVSKVVKAVTKPVKKIISSPLGQLGLTVALGPAGIGATGAGTSFLTQAARRAAINAMIQKASGQDVDLKSALISGGVGAGIGRLAPMAPGFENLSTPAQQAVLGAGTNLATSLATGQKIDPKSVAMAGGLSGLVSLGEQKFLESRGGQPLFGRQETGIDGLADTDLIESQMMDPTQDFSGTQLGEQTQTPTFRESMADLNLRRGIADPSELGIGQPAGQGYDVDMGYESTVKDIGGVKVTGEAPLGKPGFPETTPVTEKLSFIQRVKDIRSPGDALGVLKDTVMENKVLTGITLASLASTAALPQQPDESDEEYQKRLSEVEQYVRRYGANLNLPQSQINRILSNVRAESAGDVSYDFANGGRVMRNMGGPGNFSLGDLTRFIDVNPRDGIDDRDPMNGMGMRTMAMSGGIMGIPVRDNGMGVQELDYRQEGGFVPVGVKEKADDVPAMLSKNEFVMTADAVRGAGDGDIEKGAQKMYDTMKRLESKIA